MNIKVCGITQLKQLQQLDGLNVEFAGLDFKPESPRYVGNTLSGEAVQEADLDIKKVGIFGSLEYDEIMEKVEAYGLDVVQLDGETSPEVCEALMDDVEVVKTFRLAGLKGSVDELVAAYDGACDYYLFDTAVEIGGEGDAYDWKLLSKSKIEKPFFLSGAIGLQDAAKIKSFKHPDYYGVNINSLFEKSPGLKDMALVLQFKQALK